MPVRNLADSFWKFDNVIHYVNPHEISFDKIDVLLLVGHDGFRLFAVLTIPIFYLNVRGRRQLMPGLIGTGFGGLMFWLFLWFQGTVIRFGSSEGAPPLFWMPFPDEHQLTPMLAFGKKDIVAVPTENSTSMQTAARLCSIFLVSVPLFVGLIYLTLRWLLEGFLKPAFPKAFARFSARLKKLIKPLDKVPVRPVSLDAGKVMDAVSSAATDVLSTAADTAMEAAEAAVDMSASVATGDAGSATRRLEKSREAIFNGVASLLRSRLDVSNGDPEPPSWFESDFECRHRCARNHVRILLRGQRWYESQLLSVKAARKPKKSHGRAANWRSWFRKSKAKVFSSEGEGDAPTNIVKEISDRRKPLEGRESFFYPQRLKMACALSLWICLMLTLIFANLCEWAVAILQMAGQFDATLERHAAHSDQMQHVTLMGESAKVLLALLSVIGIEGAGFGSPRNFMMETLGVVNAFGIVFMLLVVCGQWYFIFQSFRRDTYALRRGACFVNKAKFREEYANKYIGYQVAHMTVSFAILLFMYVIVAAVLTPFILSATGHLEDDHALWFALWDFVVGLIVPRSHDRLGIVLPLCGSLLFQMVMNRKVFFVGPAHNNWLRLTFWYGLFDYNLIYTNALIGIAVCLSRVGMLFVFFLLFIARLDKTTMPGPTGNFLNFDAGFKTYIAMLRMDHRYNNPVFLVFGDLMLERLRESRIRAHLRIARRQHLERQDEQGPAWRARTDKVKTLKRSKLLKWALSIVEHMSDERARRIVVVRNRWQLIWRLCQQPAFRRWREETRLKRKLKLGLQNGKDLFALDPDAPQALASDELPKKRGGRSRSAVEKHVLHALDRGEVDARVLIQSILKQAGGADTVWSALDATCLTVRTPSDLRVEDAMVRSDM